MDHTKEDAVEEEQAFLSPSSSPNGAIWSLERNDGKTTKCLRFVLEVGMATIIIVLLAHILHERVEVKPSPVPKCMLLSEPI